MEDIQQTISGTVGAGGRTISLYPGDLVGNRIKGSNNLELLRLGQIWDIIC